MPLQRVYFLYILDQLASLKSYVPLRPKEVRSKTLCCNIILTLFIGTAESEYL